MLMDLISRVFFWLGLFMILLPAMSERVLDRQGFLHLRPSHIIILFP